MMPAMVSEERQAETAGGGREALAARSSDWSDEWLTMAEAAALCEPEVSPSTVAGWCRAGVMVIGGRRVLLVYCERLGSQRAPRCRLWTKRAYLADFLSQRNRLGMATQTRIDLRPLSEAPPAKPAPMPMPELPGEIPVQSDGETADLEAKARARMAEHTRRVAVFQAEWQQHAATMKGAKTTPETATADIYEEMRAGAENQSLLAAYRQWDKTLGRVTRLAIMATLFWMLIAALVGFVVGALV